MISGFCPCSSNFLECLSLRLSLHLSWVSLLLSISLHQIIHHSLKLLKTQDVYKEVKHPILWGSHYAQEVDNSTASGSPPKLTRLGIIINYKDYCEILSDKLEL